MLGPFTMLLALAAAAAGPGRLPAASVLHRPPDAPAVEALAVHSPAMEAPALRWGGRDPVTLTGCLSKGDEAGEFRLTTSDGKKYDVKSKTVPLAKHVGHTVRITGNSVAPEKGEESQGEAGEIEVTAMTHLSATCQQ